VSLLTACRVKPQLPKPVEAGGADDGDQGVEKMVF